MSLSMRISEFMRVKRFPFYVAMLIPKISLDEVEKLKIRAKIKRMHLSLQEKGSDEYRFYAKLIKRHVDGYLLTPSDKAWFIVGGSDSKDTFIKIIRHLYPLVAFPIINMSSFINILNNLSKYYDLTVLQVLLRKKLERETTKRWSRAKYGKVIKEILKAAKEHRTVLDSIRLHVKSKYTSTYVELGLDRIGVISFYDGFPDIYADLETLIIRPFLEAAYRDRERFKRLRLYIDKKTLEPRANIASIDFTDRVSLEDFEKFISTLSKTHYVYVYVKGNPHLHLLAIDKNSGGSYEIVATAKNAHIIPGPRTEVDSLCLILDALNEITSFSRVRFLP